MTEHDDSVLLAEYALGLLDDAEAKALEQRLDTEPDLQQQYVAWAEHFAGLYQKVAEVTPPASIKQSINDRLFTDTTNEPSKPFSWLWPATWLCGLVLASVVGVTLYQSQQVNFQAEYTASLVTEDQSLEVVARYDKAHNLLQVSAAKVNPAAGRSHELWLIAANSAPVSLGVISAINNQDIELSDELAAVIVGSTLAISDEPTGGSPTGSPTGAVLTTATVVEI